MLSQVLVSSPSGSQGRPVRADAQARITIARMPRFVPVACVGVDNGDNAAWLAVRILKLVKE
jgi:phosphoribosylcarboxyaminoimidazole (NCAIR) mutase